MTPEHAVRTGPEVAQGLGDAQVAKNSSGAEQLGPGDCPLLRAALALSLPCSRGPGGPRTEDSMGVGGSPLQVRRKGLLGGTEAAPKAARLGPAAAPDHTVFSFF